MPETKIPQDQETAQLDATLILRSSNKKTDYRDKIQEVSKEIIAQRKKYTYMKTNTPAYDIWVKTMDGVVTLGTSLSLLSLALNIYFGMSDKYLYFGVAFASLSIILNLVLMFLSHRDYKEVESSLEELEKDENSLSDYITKNFDELESQLTIKNLDLADMQKELEQLRLYKEMHPHTDKVKLKSLQEEVEYLRDYKEAHPEIDPIDLLAPQEVIRLLEKQREQEVK